MKLSNKILTMEYSPIRKFNKSAITAERRGKKIYHLNIGQPDIPTPPVFFEAVKNFSQEVLAYSESSGNQKLLKSVCDYFARIGIECHEDNLIMTNGGSEALLFSFIGTLDDNDDMLVAEPFYSNYHSMARAAEANIVPINTLAEEGYRFAAPKQLEGALTPKTKAICITNPGNPTGTILSDAEMRNVVDFVKKHDLWLIVDEVYREFTYDGREMRSFASFPEIEDRLIIVDSISKRFSSCGARIGFIMTKNKELYENLMKLAQSRLCVPTLEQEGAVALYGLDDSYFNATRDEYQRRRDAIYQELMKIDGIVCHKPEGAFYVMAKLPVEDTEDLLHFLLDEFEDNGETVMYAPGEGFYSTPAMGKSEVRLAYVLKESDLRRSIQLLKLGIDSYKNKYPKGYRVKNIQQ